MYAKSYLNLKLRPYDYDYDYTGGNLKLFIHTAVIRFLAAFKEEDCIKRGASKVFSLIRSKEHLIEVDAPKYHRIPTTNKPSHCK